MMDRLQELLDRRDFLHKNIPTCEKCGDRQVQILAYVDQPAQWRCRICKHKFRWEPEHCKYPYCDGGYATGYCRNTCRPT